MATVVWRKRLESSHLSWTVVDRSQKNRLHGQKASRPQMPPAQSNFKGTVQAPVEQIKTYLGYCPKDIIIWFNYLIKTCMTTGTVRFNDYTVSLRHSHCQETKIYSYEMMVTTENWAHLVHLAKTNVIECNSPAINPTIMKVIMFILFYRRCWWFNFMAVLEAAGVHSATLRGVCYMLSTFIDINNH